MVFFLFKKAPKPTPGQTSKRSSASPATAGKPTKVSPPAGAWSNTRLGAERKPSVTDAERARARETSAKIDQIESEMARDLGAVIDGPATTGNRATRSGAGPRSETVRRGPATVRAGDELGENTDSFMGRANAIEIANLGSGPVIDEAAVLFAHGQEASAEAALRKGIAESAFGDSPRTGWHMLLEILNQRDDRAAFEQAAQQYAKRFQRDAPAWHRYLTAPGQAVAQDTPSARSAVAVHLPAYVDGGVVPVLERLRVQAAEHRALALDASEVQGIDASGAELLLRVLAAFRRVPHSLTIYGAPALAAALRAAVQSGRRDPSDACWLLRLELLRIAGQSAGFDDVAIEYCLTYEVSPPAWEPAAPNLSVGTGAAPAVLAPAAPEAAPSGPLHWVGVIDGEGNPWLAALAEQARGGKDLTVDCLHLRRIEFAAASALLGLAVRLKQSGVTARLNDLNPLVTALLHMLGVGEVAELHGRR